MSNKMCPKIILEGDVPDLENRDRLCPQRAPAQSRGCASTATTPRLVSAECCAFTNYPWGRGLINFEPHEEALAMETYRTWVRLFELQKYYSWIVDLVPPRHKRLPDHPKWPGLQFCLAGRAP